MRRVIFSIIWSVPIFFVLSVGIAVAVGQVGAKEVGEKFGGLLCLGSLVVAGVLGFVGVLPGTKRRSAVSRRELVDEEDEDSTESARPAAPSRRSASPVSEYHFSVAGYFDRYMR